MKSRYVKSLAWVAAIFLAAACDKEPNVAPPRPSGGNGSSQEAALEPAPCSNNIVAHRGGSSECGQPDNSIGSLKYAMSLKLYASECDIYWTKDNNIVVAHADGNYKINGLLPWESTLDELRKAGTLKNGEKLPSLEDFLKTVMVEGNCTKLCLDIKYTSPTTYAVNAVIRACEIIKEMQAEKFCEFICTGNTTVAKTASQCMVAYKIPVGWMNTGGPKTHLDAGFTWANIAASNFTPTGARTAKEFIDAGMEISVFNVDKAGSTDGNAVSDNTYFLQNHSLFRCICSNYPKWLQTQIK